MQLLKYDKLLHFLAGFIIYIGLDRGAIYLSIDLSSLLILFLVALCGLGKEIFDKLNGNNVDMLDIAATVFGGIVGLVTLKSFL